MQLRKSKDYLDQTFYMNFEDGLIYGGILFIGICDPNIDSVVLVYWFIWHIKPWFYGGVSRRSWFNIKFYRQEGFYKSEGFIRG